MITSKSLSFLLNKNPWKTRNSIPLQIFRCSSNLPEPQPKQKQDLKEGSYYLPIIKRDPVVQTKLKRIPVQYHAVAPTTLSDETIWYPVYRFPHIRRFRSLIRFKFYLTLISSASSIYQTYLFLFEPEDSLTGVAILSATTLTVMLLLGNFARKFICQIYVTEDADYVRLARFSFYGKRIDMVLPSSAIVPLTENNEKYTNSFLKLKTNRPTDICLDYDFHEFYDEIFNITLSFGGIADVDKFEKVFGRILSRKMTF